jgi:hypothetical protein
MSTRLFAGESNIYDLVSAASAASGSGRRQWQSYFIDPDPVVKHQMNRMTAGGRSPHVRNCLMSYCSPRASAATRASAVPVFSLMHAWVSFEKRNG